MITEKDNAFMREAIAEAEIAESRGNYGIGAVIVHNGEIVSRGRNEIITRGNKQYAHSEILAMESIRDTDLFVTPTPRELTVYTTLGPCPQCWGMMMVNGIGRVVYGAGDTISTQDYATSVPLIFLETRPEIEELGGDLGRICEEIFSRSRVKIDAALGYKV